MISHFLKKKIKYNYLIGFIKYRNCLLAKGSFFFWGKALVSVDQLSQLNI